jgi:hypothetical protein
MQTPPTGRAGEARNKTWNIHPAKVARLDLKGAKSKSKVNKEGRSEADLRVRSGWRKS